MTATVKHVQQHGVVGREVRTPAGDIATLVAIVPVEDGPVGVVMYANGRMDYFEVGRLTVCIEEVTNGPR